MKPKRKSISKKLRFEIFKRDSFKCQYCGQSAPEVLLHIDHIKPVANGGDNDITNLITSCVNCNQGKGKRELNDNTAITKQRQQLEDLNERRAQLEMMVEWRRGLSEIDDMCVEAVAEAISNQSQFQLNELGYKNIKKWLRKFDVTEILDAVETSFDQYLEWENDEEATSESWNKAFSYIPRIASVRRREKDNPVLSDLYYIRGILRNRMYVNETYIMDLLQEAADLGADLDSIKSLAKSARSWTKFRTEIEDFIGAKTRGEDGKD